MRTSSVVRVFVTFQEPLQDSPWQRGRTDEASGSGVVIGDGRILTGAHVVTHATFVQVRTITDAEKYVARIEGICHDADLALLRVDDPKFMQGLEKAHLGELPAFQDRVAVVGYPIGGEELSITAGVVSRIEVQDYAHSQRFLLAITVDAAINDGSSGGPVFDERGDVVGIAFQGLDDADNVGHMVPAAIVRRFLTGIEDGRPLDVPGLGIRWQNLENPTLRRVLGLGAEDSGVLVCEIDDGSSAAEALEPGDALLAIDGHRIANNGTVRYRDHVRTSFDVFLGEHFVGDRIPVEISRSGERRRIDLTLRPHEPLVPRNRYEPFPRYLCLGGLVFQPLRREFLTTWDKWWDSAPKHLLHLYLSGRRTAERHEVVTLTSVLADELNVGFGHLHNDTVVSVDGAHPLDFADFVRRVDAARGTLEIRTDSGGRIVLDLAETRARNAVVLERYGVPRDRSARIER